MSVLSHKTVEMCELTRSTSHLCFFPGEVTIIQTSIHVGEVSSGSAFSAGVERSVFPGTGVTRVDEVESMKRRLRRSQWCARPRFRLVFEAARAMCCRTVMLLRGSRCRERPARKVHLHNARPTRRIQSWRECVVFKRLRRCCLAIIQGALRLLLSDRWQSLRTAVTIGLKSRSSGLRLIH